MLHPTRLLCSLGLAGLLAGCGSTYLVGPPPSGDSGPGVDAGLVQDTGVTVDRPTPIVDAAQRLCTRSQECGRGEQCVGPEGCSVPWTCQPAQGRACTADVAPFCGCDGATFGASSTCPDRPYLYRGPCEMPPPPPPLDGGVTPPPPFDGGTTPTACVMPDGTVCPLGAICPLPDRCAECRCGPRGLQCVMTPCLDGGVMPPPPFDAGPATCNIRGVICRVGEVCLIDRCTQCACAPGGNVSCRTVPGCGVDSGVIRPDAGVIRDSGVIRPDSGTVRPDASVPGCAPQQAMGEGFCERLLGIYWQGNRCVAIGGCTCVGADCGRSFPSFQACETVHLICPR